MFDETVFRNIYRNMNEQILPASAIVEHIRLAARPGAQRSRAVRRHMLRRGVAIAAIVLCLLAATPALAVNSPSIYRLMYAVSPAVAQFFVPVQEACENNGVRMEVISAYAEGDTAKVYVTMQDLTGNRIDETTDLFDSESIHFPFDSIGNCTRVDYDPATKTATFLITVSSMDGSPIRSGKVTFSVGCFISKKREYLDMPVTESISSLPMSTQTQSVYRTGVGGAADIPALFDAADGMVEALKPAGAAYTPLEGFEISAAGYLQDALHIQLSVRDTLQNDNHAQLYLKNAAGEIVYSAYSYGFWQDGDWKAGVRCDEFVFDIAADRLSDYTLYGSFWTSGLRTDGDWQVTFPISANEYEKR